MVLLPGGEFLMGDARGEGIDSDGEAPVHRVVLPPFRIDAAAVSNAEFAEFVADTGHVTDAERFGFSFVFAAFVTPGLLNSAPRVVGSEWWAAVPACWRQPEGPGSTIADRTDHPVVHVSWFDARAYAAWAGARLPTEAEWEYAARGGLHAARYPWGDELTPAGTWRCNIWQGDFPVVNTGEDGHLGTAPVTAFAPNGFGFFNMVGNVWEWCSDWFAAAYYSESPRYAPGGTESGAERVIRGGSYLCHESYCNRYRVSARSSNTPDSSTGHMGFRCAANA